MDWCLFVSASWLVLCCGILAAGRGTIDVLAIGLAGCDGDGLGGEETLSRRLDELTELAADGDTTNAFAIVSEEDREADVWDRRVPSVTSKRGIVLLCNTRLASRRAGPVNLP